MAVIRATILGMATEDVQDDQKVADPVEIPAARADPADLGGQGYLVALEDLAVQVALVAPEAVPREEDPLAAAEAAAVEVVAQGHPIHLSST